MIVVFDTNVLVAALIAKGLCQEAVETAFLARLRQHVRLVVPARLPEKVSRDLDDDIVLVTPRAFVEKLGR